MANLRHAVITAKMTIVITRRSEMAGQVVYLHQYRPGLAGTTQDKHPVQHCLGDPLKGNVEDINREHPDCVKWGYQVIEGGVSDNPLTQVFRCQRVDPA